MNRVYRLVWSHVQSVWVAVAESSRGRGKGSSRKLIASVILFSGAAAQAAPEGGQVVSGVGSVTQIGNTTTIIQTSTNISLSWKSFNTSANETVNFVQPSGSAIAINRIYDTNGSQIMGRLNANGQVYLINPNGILFGKGSQINVGALVASTLDLNDASVISNTRSFSGNGPGRILNLGAINAANGGYVALLGNQVSSQGSIVAQLGSIVLGGGNAVTLNFNGNSLVNMVVEQSVLNSLAENGGLIKADGGLVVLSAGAKDTLLASMVNNSGTIEAHTLVHHEGKITLLGGMEGGTVNVGGTLDASALNGGNGGFIETSAAHVMVADAAKVSTAAPAGLTGTWLIDPIDFTIAAGSGAPTSSGIGASTLSSELANTSISIATDASTTGSGDIFVNSTVSWSANNLTLSAHRNININANLNGSGTASLALKYGMGASNGVVGGVASNYSINAAVNLAAGANFSTQLGTSGSLKNYTVITSLGTQGGTAATDLQGMQRDLTLNYALGSNIDASATAGWNPSADGTSYAGFKPVGYTANGTTTFTGIFDGLGHTISNLTINRPGAVDVGLFGAAANYATISNVGLLGGSVVGGAGTGGLLGTAITASISNSYNTGTVSGAAGTGGLAGVITTGGVRNSYNTGTVSGAAGTGGLIGVLITGSISDSYNIAAVTGNAGTGGLAGVMTTGSISSSFSTGNVVGNAGTGGLAGGLTTGDVSGSYTTGNVTGDAGTGGLAGTVTTGSISNSYTTGNVVGAAGTGGLAGGITTGSVSSSFTTGTVTGGAGTSSLAGTSPTGSITNSFAVSAGQPIDFAAFMASSTSGNWVLVNGKPVLATLIKTFTITANDFTKTYNGLSYSGGNGVSYSEPYQSYLTGTLSYTGTSQDARNASRYVITPGGLTSTNSQYVVSYVSGTLTINQANLTLSGTQVYNGSTAYAGANLSAAGVNGETFAISGTGNTTNLNSKNVQSGSTLASVTGLAVAEGNTNAAIVSNYNTLTTSGSSVNVMAANLILSSSDVSKTYDAGFTAVGTAIKVGGLTTVSGDTLSGGTFAFIDKNVGSVNKTVTATGITVNDGNNGANYNVSYVTNKASTISKADLSVTGLSATGKVYDTSVAAGLTGTAAVAAFSGDVVTLVGTATGTFASKGVGSAKAVTVSGNTLSGTDAGNYTLVQQTGLSATVTQADLVVSGLTAATQTYTATTVASLGGAGAVTALAGDTVTLGGTAAGAFVDKNIGSAKAITVTGNTLSGTDALNYNLVQQTGLSATVDKANLVITGVTADSRVYDATTVATLSGTAVVSALANDVVTVSGTTAAATFADKNQGTGKTVTVSGYTLSGTDAGNYTLVQQTGLSATISGLALASESVTVTAPDSNLTYSAKAIFEAAVANASASIASLINAGNTMAKDINNDDKSKIANFIDEASGVSTE